MTDAQRAPLSLPSLRRGSSLRSCSRRLPHDNRHDLASGTGGGASAGNGSRSTAVLGDRGAADGRSERGRRKCAQSAKPDPLHRRGSECLAEAVGTRGAGDRIAARQRRGDDHHGLSGPVTRVCAGALAVAGLAVFSAPAAAQTQLSSICGVTGEATAPTTITYDPFSPGGLSDATIPLILRRNRNLLLGRTREVSLVLTAPTSAPPLTMTYQGHNVLYPEGAAAGRPRGLTDRDNGAGAAGEIRYRFGGLFSSDVSEPLNLRVSVPPGTDLTAGEPIYFDILYICSADGLMLEVPFPYRVSRALRLDVRVVSALQAYYAGSALDFGEIGDVTSQQVQADPARYTTPAMNSLRVRSSGPYEVSIRSQNDFRLMFPGANAGDPAQTIRYRVRFLGQDVSSNSAAVTRTCARAGVSGGGGVLPIRAQLAEGGAGKTPSSAYADTVTVTFTPIITASSAQSCGGL